MVPLNLASPPSLQTPRVINDIERDGYCIIPEVIPGPHIKQICDEIIFAQRVHEQQTEAEHARIRACGHRVGVPGVGLLKQAINSVQSFAPYLADSRLLGVAEHYFGDYVRISCTDAIITHPGSQRGYWHADWPFNGTNSTHIKSPYSDSVMHLSTIWMLTPFTAENGATFLLPGSHRNCNNPAASGMPEIDRDGHLHGQIQAVGEAGSVLLYDSRLWHAAAPNTGHSARVALIVRYAPWWLNLTPIMPLTPDHQRMVMESNGKAYDSPPLRREIYDILPEQVQPLYRHWFTL